MFIEAKELRKSYGEGGSFVQVLNGVSISCEEGSITVILGPSGSGKSTLLNVIGGLDTVDEGNIRIDGLEITGMKPDILSDYRRDYLGFIFQFYNLIPNLSVWENIEVCRYLTSSPLDMDELLDVLGLSSHRNKFPSQLSGGQQQRCAIARALVKNPKVLLCDEPTGAVDSKTAKEILALLKRVNQTYGTTMLIVTHDETVRSMAHQVIRITDGIVSEWDKNDGQKSMETRVK